MRRAGAVPLALCVGAVLAGCSASPPKASASRVGSRQQLVGGKRALGEVGDYVLNNGIIHAVVQDVGHSRGFGAFGGSLIDVDLVRGGRPNQNTVAHGNDQFTEMFPAFFLQAIEPSKVEVVADGSDGPAIVRVSGMGGEFLSVTKSINELVLGDVPLAYQVDYILEPGKQYLKIVTTVSNPDPVREAGFPLSIPFGFVTLLGESQRLFVPGKAGYDLRFRLEERYKAPSALEAFPGEVASMVATEGRGVSYALAASPRGAGYLANKPDYYPTAQRDSMLIPVAAGSFLATFWGKPPTTFAPGRTYSYTGYLAVGAGDVASAQEVIYGIDDEGERAPVATGRLVGRVVERGTSAGLSGVTVVIEDDAGNFFTSARSQTGGNYQARVPPGRYRAHAVDPVRAPTVSEGFVEIAADASARLDVWLDRTATLTVSVRDDQGRPLPSKVSVEGRHDHVGAGPARLFLYDFKLGESLRSTDLDPDTEDPETRRYLESSFFLANGSGGQTVRPGRYRVYASRGPEYELAYADVELKPGAERAVSFVLKQVMPTPGYISGDFHVHSVNSVDSNMELPERVVSFAAEGVDFFASTDHNYVTDFAPTVEALGLQDWLKTTVGLELTTLEMGHFNAYPLVVDPGPVSHGSFRWFRRSPGELFAQLRGLGKYPGQTLVQVNHPRDSLLGYFNAFNMHSYTGVAVPATGTLSLDQTPLPDGSPSPYAPESFSLDFDVLEVFNGKREDQLHHYRVPATVPEGADPTVPACSGTQTRDCIPAPGELLEQTVSLPDPNAPGGTREVAQPVHPGALDDYYTLYAQGRRITAVGNSDSHSASAEAGLPRTYLYVGATADGSMRGLSELAVVEALRSQRAVVTNGPFVELTVNGQPVGSEVVAPDGSVEVSIRVQAASWVDVRHVVLKRGGKSQDKLPEVLATYEVPPSAETLRFEHTERFNGLPDDSFLVVEVSGERSMWPVYTPYELPTVMVNEAVASIGGPLGLGNKWGRYTPSQVQQVKPFAFTNPIRVVRQPRQGLEAARPVLPLGAGATFTPRRLPDLRRLLGAFHADAH